MYIHLNVVVDVVVVETGCEVAVATVLTNTEELGIGCKHSSSTNSEQS